MSKFSRFVMNVQNDCRSIIQRMGPIPKDKKGLSVVAIIIEANIPNGVEIKDIYFSPEGVELHALNFDGDGQYDFITLNLNPFFRVEHLNYPKQIKQFKVSPW